MGAEIFLTKIAAAVLKKAAFGSAFTAVSAALQIYSIFELARGMLDCVESMNDCCELGVNECHVISDVLADRVADQLVDIGNTTFEVRKTNSGVYIASSIVPEFRAPDTYGNLGSFFDYGSLRSGFFDYGKL